MKRSSRVILSEILLLVVFVFAGCGSEKSTTKDEGIVSSGKIYANAQVIELSEDKATFNGKEIQEYDYTWNCDPTVNHDEVEDAPAEYYTGTKPNAEDSVYIDHELYYFPLLEESDFVKIRYDGEQEWAYYYKDGVNDEYIFATLPSLGNSLPTQMMHSAQEASENKVLHITKEGTYVLNGSWKGQIKIDLGEDAYSNEEAKVTLILDGADIECTVAPAIIFKEVYECDNNWEEEERTDAVVDTSEAGANIILADGSENYISGNNVFRMLKTKYKNKDSLDEIKVQKKMRKTDGALYSYMSMNICGEEQQTGKLVVNSGFEGIDSELHLTVKGGNITVNSQDDGMNVNEDHVSVLTFLGGEVTLNAAQGAEGDGVDSNGYICVNGGIINVNGVRVPDNALDSEDGIYYNSGSIIIDGEQQDLTPGTVVNEIGNRGFDKGHPDKNGFDKEFPERRDFDKEFPEGKDFPRGDFEERNMNEHP